MQLSTLALKLDAVENRRISVPPGPRIEPQFYGLSILLFNHNTDWVRQPNSRPVTHIAHDP